MAIAHAVAAAHAGRWPSLRLRVAPSRRLRGNTKHWHEWIGDPTLADAILDRLIHNAYKVTLTGPSRRKERSKSKKS